MRKLKELLESYSVDETCLYLPAHKEIYEKFLETEDEELFKQLKKIIENIDVLDFN